MIAPYTEVEEEQIQKAMMLADKDMVDEIIREAEIFIGEQFKAALAADSRALTLAGLLGAGITLLTGNLVTITGAYTHVWPYAAGIVVIIASFIVALFNAVAAAKPSLFDYGGNSPDEWIADIQSKTSLKDALSGQAFAYAVGIRKNKVILETNQSRIKRALNVALSGIVVGCAIAAFLAIVRLGSGSFP